MMGWAAVLMVAAPLTSGALAAFPLWDDASIWLLIDERGVGALGATQPDRPVMAMLWSVLAPSAPFFWTAAFLAQAVLWPVLGVLAARLWTMLFPGLSRYAPVVACLSVAPVLSKVQMITANVALASLLSVALAYAAMLLLMGFVKRRGGAIAVMAIALPALAAGTVLQEYAVAVTAAMLVVLIPWMLRRHAPAVATRARVAALAASAAVVVGYAAYLGLADRGFRPEVHPLHALRLGESHVTRLPFWFADSAWRAVVGTLGEAIGAIDWSSRSGLPAVAYGVLVAAVLVYATWTGTRVLPHRRVRHFEPGVPGMAFDWSGAPGTADAAPDVMGDRTYGRAAVVLLLALIAGVAPAILMGRLPWDPADGMSTRFGLPVVPVAAMLIVLAAVSLVRPRLVVVPIALLGFVAGHASLAQAWFAREESRQVAALSRALAPHVSSGGGHTVAVVALPERALGPRRPWELAARLAAPWPPELRRKFWAYRYGNGVGLGYREQGQQIFGERSGCRRTEMLDVDIRMVARKGPIDRVLWVAPGSDGSVTVEPYCLASAPAPAGAPRTARSQAPMSPISSSDTEWGIRYSFQSAR